MISEGSRDTENWSKIQLCITGINYILKYIQIEKLFKIAIIFQNITVFIVFRLNKCSLGEHKKLIFER